MVQIKVLKLKEKTEEINLPTSPPEHIFNDIAVLQDSRLPLSPFIILLR